MPLEQFIKPHDDNALTKSEIKAFEDAYSIKLPEEMIELYMKQNGGYLEKCGSKELDLPLKKLYPIAHTFCEHMPIIEELLKCQKKDGFIPMNYIPFCSDEAGDDYYLRMDAEGYGKVYYIFSEFLDDFLKDPGNSLVADSFKLFSEMIENID